MNLEESYPDSVTYAIIDNHSRKYFPEEYASLPAPSTIEIEIIPDEQFRPSARVWPSMWEQRVKVGHLTEQQDGTLKRKSAKKVYASVSEDSKPLSTPHGGYFLRVWFSTRNKTLSCEDWSMVQWVEPFKRTYIELERKVEPTRRPYLRSLVPYYLMANAHLDTLGTSAAVFPKDFEASCRCVAEMHQVRRAPSSDGIALTSPPPYAYNVTNGNDNHSVHTRKRLRGDESRARPSTSIKREPDASFPSRTAADTSRGKSDKCPVKIPVGIPKLCSNMNGC
jgi:hypothetical protein